MPVGLYCFFRKIYNLFYLTYFRIEFSQNYKHCDAAIKVNDSLSMTGDQIAKKDIFVEPTAWLYLGGLPHETPNNDIIPVGGFIGCMSFLKVTSN